MGKVTILLRLSPIIPFSAFNYFMGLTGVSFRDYNIAHIGMLPGSMAYCFIGGTLGAIGESVGFADPVVLTVTIVGTILAIIGMVYISFVAKKEFAKIAEQQKQKDMEDDPESGVPITENDNGDKPTVEGDDDDNIDNGNQQRPPTDPNYQEPEDQDNENEQSLSLGN